jgi:hypothetical protein
MNRSVARAAAIAVGIGWMLAACESPAPESAAPADGASAGQVGASAGQVGASAEQAGASAGGAGAAAAFSGGADGAALGDVVIVYRSPTCGCCGAWVEHLRENGFAVEVEDVSDLGRVKRRLGVPPSLVSCHTAVVGGRVVEGHVPADAVRRFLEDERWSGMAGLAVPGMPIGSPGMESPGRAPEPYDIVAWDSAGATVLFERRGP